MLVHVVVTNRAGLSSHAATRVLIEESAPVFGSGAITLLDVAVLPGHAALFFGKTSPLRVQIDPASIILSASPLASLSVTVKSTEAGAALSTSDINVTAPGPWVASFVVSPADVYLVTCHASTAAGNSMEPQPLQDGSGRPAKPSTVSSYE